MSDKKYLTRMGDGEMTYMTKEEIREDVLAGMDDAVTRGKSEPMSQNDVDYMVEILTDENRRVGVALLLTGAQTCLYMRESFVQIRWNYATRTTAGKLSKI